jgi:hypothetical protein
LSGHQLVFIGGLHKSGTSLTHRLLRAHPDVSGFTNTGAIQDEGQHLQHVYPTARTYGGPGFFAFDDRAHLTEQSDLSSSASSAALFDDWTRYWDLSKAVLVEKSPPNLIQSRFLQSLFPGAKFVFIVRHPITVSRATQKWSRQSDTELVRHWLVAHRILLDDLAHLDHWAWLRYEDLIANPNAMLRALWNFIGLAPIPPAESIDVEIDARYLSQYEPPGDLNRIYDDHAAALIGRFGYSLEAPYYSVSPGESGLATK